MKHPKIKYVEPLKDYRLFIIFDNGIIKTYSLKEKLNNPIFSHLKDEKLFNSVQVDIGGYGVIWNDEIDLSEFELWENGIQLSTIQKLSQKVAV